MLRITAKGLNGFSVTVDKSRLDYWVQKAKRLGCLSVVIEGEYNYTYTYTIFFQQ